MCHGRLFLRRAPIVLATVLLSLALGCASWRTTETPPATLLAKEQGLVMRVTTTGSRPIILRQTSMAGDTLRGRVYSSLDEDPEWGFHRAVSIPQQQIQKVEVRKTDTVKTTLLGVSLAALVASIVVGATAHVGFGYGG